SRAEEGRQKSCSEEGCAEKGSEESRSKEEGRKEIRPPLALTPAARLSHTTDPRCRKNPILRAAGNRFRHDGAALLEQLDQGVRIFLSRLRRLARESGGRTVPLSVARRHGDELHQFQSHFIATVRAVFRRGVFRSVRCAGSGGFRFFCHPVISSLIVKSRLIVHSGFRQMRWR